MSILQLLILLSFIFFSVNSRIITIHKDKQKQGPEGQIIPVSDEDKKNSESYKIAVEYAQEHFQNACKVDKNWEWDKVIEARYQVVEGFLFYLNIDLQDQDEKRLFLIEVWVKPLNSKTGKENVSISECKEIQSF